MISPSNLPRCGASWRGSQYPKQTSPPKYSQIKKPYNQFLLLFLFASFNLLIHQFYAKMSFKTTATIASFGGKLLKLTHDATSTSCQMALNLYLPPQAALHKVPVLFFLSGLTCTGDNCAEKGFFQSAAAEKGVAVVYPDTSPRTSLPSH